MVEGEARHTQVVIVGAGFAGLGAAMLLKRMRFDDFVVIERAHAVGGGFRDRAYPGRACELESAHYAFSFAPYTGFTRAFPPRAEVLAYLERCVADFRLAPHLSLGCEVLSARFSRAAQRWHVETTRGRYVARVLIAGVGPGCAPHVPLLPGIERFEGDAFHVASWDPRVELAGRRVAVVGTGASAAQLVPAIQPRVSRLCVFQRTPVWVVPRGDHALSAKRERFLARHPLARRLLAYGHHGRRALLASAPARRMLERRATRHLEASTTDVALRAKLTPCSPLGDARVVASDDYVSALARENVALVTEPIREVGPRALVTADGALHEVDTIVYATGFEATESAFAARVRGRDGRTLSENWACRPAAHLGTMVTGFPNLFLLLGPGLEAARGPLIPQLERQLALVVTTLTYLWNQGAATIEPTFAAQRAWLVATGRSAGTAEDPSAHPPPAVLRRIFGQRLAGRLRFRPEEYQLARVASPEALVAGRERGPARRRATPESGMQSADTQESR